VNWLKQLLTRNELKNSVAEEIRQHLDERTEVLVAEGLGRSEAEDRARREFGNRTLIEERSRETWDWSAFESLLVDIRRAIRRLVQAPGFTFVCLVTLALGIGANAGIFTLLNAVLLKSLPVPAPEQLFLVKQSGRSAEKTRFSYPFFQRFSQQLPALTSMAAMAWPDSFYVSSGGPDEPATGQLVSSNFFEVFETHAVLGRLFAAQKQDKAREGSVAVISYGFWQKHLAGDSAVIGQKLLVNHVPVTVIGVTVPGFFGARPEARPDFWMLLTDQSEVRYHSHYSSTTAADPIQPWPPQENIHWLQFVVRIQDTAALPRFSAVMNRLIHEDIGRKIQHEPDPAQQQALRHTYLTLEPGQKGFATLREQFRQPLFLLLALASVILLITCANVANLLLARATARERANAIQLSIGAGRARVLREMLIESLLLSLAGGFCGIAVAFWCARIIPKWASAKDVALPLNLTPDWRILVFGFSTAILTGFLFGLAPALQCARVDPVVALKANAKGVHGSGSARRWSLRRNLVIGQVALCLLLLVGAGMFWQTLRNYSQLDPGFDRDHLLSIRLETHLVNYQPPDFQTLYRRLIDSLNAIPGVRSSSIATCALVVGCFDASDVYLADERTETSQRFNAQVNAVSIHYFETTGIQLLRGRPFGPEDNEHSPRIAIVNQTLANRFSKNRDIVGRRFAYDLNSSQRFEIVGIVSDARVNDVRQVAPPLIYFSIEQAPGNVDSIDVRATAAPQSLISQARQKVLRVDPRLSIVEISTMSDQVERNLTQPRLIARLTAMFGLLALALACLGLYGVMSYMVGRRTAEIGVRLALGSSRSKIVWLMWKETLFLVTTGAILGLLVSVVAMHLVMGFLYGLSPGDPETTILATSLLLIVSMAASFFPAWRAATVNPMEALRSE
jgi:predicted permease